MIYVPFPSIEYSAHYITKYKANSMIREIYLALKGPERKPNVPQRTKRIQEDWAGAENALALYGIYLVQADRISRSNGMVHHLEFPWFIEVISKTEYQEPWWFGIPAVHLSHRVLMTRENPLLYRHLLGINPEDWTNESLVQPVIINGTPILKAN